jgi:hypothetical protein
MTAVRLWLVKLPLTHLKELLRAATGGRLITRWRLRSANACATLNSLDVRSPTSRAGQLSTT